MITSHYNIQNVFRIFNKLNDIYKTHAVKCILDFRNHHSMNYTIMSFAINEHEKGVTFNHAAFKWKEVTIPGCYSQLLSETSPHSRHYSQSLEFSSKQNK